MKFVPTKLAGVMVIEPDCFADERGQFVRTWCRAEFAAAGLNIDVAQCSLSFNHRRGTLRGMHFQAPPHGECKLVRCTRGALLDVALDLRPASPTYCQWFGVELTAENRKALYIPLGLAHGFVTLTDATEIAYQMSHQYVAEAGRGVRWNDPAFGIEWPIAPTLMNERDRCYPDFVRGTA